ncbi:hypothetical protein BJ742DRAFT_888666, partial [Cladochytrium replicatum]
PEAVSLFSSPAYNYTIRWGTNATNLNVVLALRTPFANASSVAQSQLFRPFLGFGSFVQAKKQKANMLCAGFGRTMIRAQFVVCHFDPTYTKYKVHEHLPVSGYYPPTPVNDENWLAVRPLSGGFTENVIYCTPKLYRSRLSPWLLAPGVDHRNDVYGSGAWSVQVSLARTSIFLEELERIKSSCSEQRFEPTQDELKACLQVELERTSRPSSSQRLWMGCIFICPRKDRLCWERILQSGLE